MRAFRNALALLFLIAGEANAQGSGWRLRVAVGGAVGDGATGDKNYTTGYEHLAKSFELGAARTVGKGLVFDAGPILQKSSGRTGIGCPPCYVPVHLLGVFGTLRQQFPRTERGWGVVAEAGLGGTQLLHARRQRTDERIQVDGPALLAGIELRTREIWHVSLGLELRNYLILRPDGSVFKFQTVSLAMGTR